MGDYTLALVNPMQVYGLTQTKQQIDERIGQGVACEIDSDSKDPQSGP